MSKQFPGGLITKTPVTPAGPYQTGAAPGIWTLAEQAYWKKQGLWPTAGLNPTDPYFPYVTALFHGDGTNGAQNNTFLDSSTNNFTITRNGNTTQGTFTPYGANWSNYFNASASRLEVVNSNSSMIAQGTAFTLESWVFINSNTATGNTYNTSFPFVCTSASSSSLGNGRLYSFGTTTFGFWDRASASWLTISWTPLTNQWFHFALVSTGTVFTLYINGTSVGSLTDSTSYYADSAYNFYIAAYTGNGTAGSPPVPNMYVSNFRYTKAQVYTSTFTPSTTPLTAIANTTVLTCQSNRFIDNSTNAYTVTPLGTTTPSVQRFSPFSPTSEYSTSTIGGSGYFDGSGDYLSVADNTAFDVSGGQEFTIEGWWYPTSLAPTYQEVLTKGAGIQIYTSGSTINVALSANNTGTYFVNTSFGTLNANAWSHIALVRSGNIYYGFLNGVRTTLVTTSSSPVTGSDPFLIGVYSGNLYPTNGYISNVRFVKGTAVYTTSFTPPTTPLTAITNTSLLLSYTNAGILDNAMISDQETVGNAQISTSVYKYGTGSMSFDGTDDRLVSVANPGFAFGTGNFTVECWINPNNVSGASQLGFLQTSTSAGGLQTAYTTGIIIAVGMNAAGGALTGGLLTNVAGTNVGSNSAVLATGTWYHIAVVRNSGAVTVYVNGNVHATGTAAGNCTGQNLCIGGYYSTSYLYNGYIDDLRITKGIARYTTTFTPPTSAFPNQ